MGDRNLVVRAAVYGLIVGFLMISLYVIAAYFSFQGWESEGFDGMAMRGFTILFSALAVITSVLMAVAVAIGVTRK